MNCDLIDDSDNIEAKKAVLAEFEWAVGLGYSLESPDFKVFYLAQADAKIYDAAGNVLVHEQF